MPQQITESVALTEISDEAAVRSGRMLVQAISAGLGSSGYYTPAVLEQAAKDKLITRGTPLHLDHASETEHRDRPGRSVQTIAGVFTGDAAWDPQRQAIIGEIQIFSPHRERLAEMAPYIGLSISGSASDITRETVDGREVSMIESLAAIDSVDFVVRAGRGGQVLTAESGSPSDALRDHVSATYGVALREAGLTIQPAATPPQDPPAAPAGSTTESSQEMNMPQIEEARLRELTEAEGKVTAAIAEAAAEKARADKAEAALIERDRRDAVTKTAREAVKDLHPAMADRIVESVLRDLPADDAALTVKITAAKEAELAYAAQFAPKGVTGFGATAPATESAATTRPDPWAHASSVKGA